MECNVSEDEKQLVLNELAKRLAISERSKRNSGSHRTRWKKRLSSYRKEFNFPAVYRFLDEYNNLLYIGKASDFAYRMTSHFVDGHLKDDQYARVKKIEYSRCASDTDAAIIEHVLLSYYKPEFNKLDVGDLPTVVFVDDILSSLHWQEYISDDADIDDKKNDLYQQLRDFDDWSFERQKEFVENKYDEYVVKHCEDDLSVREEYDELFEIVLMKVIGSYDVLADRKRLCDIIQQSYLPNLEYKWFKYCYTKMCVKNFSRYGDVWWAFAHNYYASLGMICVLSLAPFVIPLAVYDFESDEYDDEDDDEFNALLSENDHISSVSSYKSLRYDIIDGTTCLNFKCDMLRYFIYSLKIEYDNYLSSDLVDSRGRHTKTHFAQLCGGISVSHLNKLWKFDVNSYRDSICGLYN